MREFPCVRDSSSNWLVAARAQPRGVADLSAELIEPNQHSGQWWACQRSPFRSDARY